MLQLGKAEGRVTEGSKLLEEQRALIAKMANEGQDLAAAKGLLDECERMQQRHGRSRPAQETAAETLRLWTIVRARTRPRNKALIFMVGGTGIEPVAPAV